MIFGRSGHRAERPRDVRFGTRPSPSSEVTTRFLTDEERNELDRRCPRPVIELKQPIQTIGQQRYQEGIALAQHTKEAYLQLRAEGKNRAQIAAEWGMKEKSLVGNYLAKWGLRKEDEDAMLAIVEKSVPPVDKPAPPVDNEEDEPLQDAPNAVQEESQDDVGDAQEKEGPKVEWNEVAKEQKASSGAFLESEEAADVSQQAPTVVPLSYRDTMIALSLNAFADDVYQTACDKGWHNAPVSLPVLIALMHSELSEALEADRKSKGNEAVEIELADVLIRLLDTARTHSLDVVGAALRKAAYNKTREIRHGGLKY